MIYLNANRSAAYRWDGRAHQFEFFFFGGAGRWVKSDLLTGLFRKEAGSPVPEDWLERYAEDEGWQSVPDADYWHKTISPRLAALRVEDGKFTVVESLADDSTFATMAAVLNAEGDALLIASEHNFDGITSETGLQTMQGLDLRVQPLDGSAVTYQGRLNLGGEREWGRLAGASSRIMERVVDFPTIQKDRG